MISPRRFPSGDLSQQCGERGADVICVGTGNNGSDNLHASGRLGQGETKGIEFSVGVYEPVMNIQLWKSYVDEMEIYIEAPSGERIGPLSEKAEPRDILRGEQSFWFITESRDLSR